VSCARRPTTNRRFDSITNFAHGWNPRAKVRTHHQHAPRPGRVCALEIAPTGSISARLTVADCAYQGTPSSFESVRSHSSLIVGRNGSTLSDPRPRSKWICRSRVRVGSDDDTDARRAVEAFLAIHPRRRSNHFDRAQPGDICNRRPDTNQAAVYREGKQRTINVRRSLQARIDGRHHIMGVFGPHIA